MTLAAYLAWYNLIFIAPFLAALLYLAVYAASGLTFGDAETEAAGEGEVSGDAETDADAEPDCEVEADVDVEAYGHLEVGVETALIEDMGGGTAAHAVSDLDAVAVQRPVSRRALRRCGRVLPVGLHVLRFLGVGRAPLSILLMVLGFTWGFLGLAGNLLLQEHPRLALAPWLISVPVALIGSAISTRALSAGLGRWLPSLETSARERCALVGQVGEAVLPIDQQFGLVLVRDARGNAHQVPCRVAEGLPPIPKGASVRLTAYEVSARIYHAVLQPARH
jgi:membrane protein implicated in regulation of membrane protease activity